MSSIISIGIKKEEIAKLPDNKGYVNLTVTLDDTVGKYGHNVSVSVEQTKEQRDAKAKKVFVGNGKVVWTRDGVIKTAKQMTESGNDEPF